MTEEEIQMMRDLVDQEAAIGTIVTNLEKAKLTLQNFDSEFTLEYISTLFPAAEEEIIEPLTTVLTSADITVSSDKTVSDYMTDVDNKMSELQAVLTVIEGYKEILANLPEVPEEDTPTTQFVDVNKFVSNSNAIVGMYEQGVNLLGE